MTTVEAPHTAQSCGGHNVYDLEYGKGGRREVGTDEWA
jgi:hypothetical protein